jgi:hypothetical protein
MVGRIPFMKAFDFEWIYRWNFPFLFLDVPAASWASVLFLLLLRRIKFKDFVLIMPARIFTPDGFFCYLAPAARGSIMGFGVGQIPRKALDVFVCMV